MAIVSPERRSVARFFWLSGICLLVLLFVVTHVSGGHGVVCAPYLLVPVFLFAMVVADAWVWVGFEERVRLSRWVARDCLFQRPPPAAFL